ncbi:MAG: response regulator [Desulfobacteraceae bacterium]|nr:response regulator [Desulfobacteraceae bacterium]
MHSIISSTGEMEIKAMRKEELSKARQKLKNYVEIAYNTLESNYENIENKKWLQKEYGLQLSKIIDIAESIVREHIALVSSGKVNMEEARKNILGSISRVRYDADTGYMWINEEGQRFSKMLAETQSDNLSDWIPKEMGLGYVWINDMSKPYPKMLMHPTIPSLDGKILDDKKFNCAQGIKKNLFVAMREVVENDGEGFVDYVWPKPTKDGLTKEQPKLSYVRAIPELNWIIGTGIYIDDAMDKAIEKSKQDLKKMRYNAGEGYFWINDKGSPYPTMIMHPTMPELNGNVMDDPKYNVVNGEPRHLFKAIIKTAAIKDGGFIDYLWPKPTPKGVTTEARKLSHVKTFAPFGWIIGTGVYIDSIDHLIEEKVNTIKSTNFYLLMTILSVAVALFIFLTIASYFLIDRLFIRKINQANDDLQQEIEERKKTEKELIVARKQSEVANSAKSEFLANMSHEIRTPMNAVIGLAYLLKQTDLTVQQLDYLSKISLSADNLLSIINDILDFSKIEAAKLKLETISFSLRSDILQNVSQVVGLAAAQKRLEIMLDIEPGLPDQLKGDPVRLRQILINLMNNAVKFTEKGEITLDIKKLDSHDERLLLQFTVRDTGVGMTEDQLAGLFTAFSQADASTTRKFGGTGLGLTISKTLAEMMGGEIGATSVQSKGSTFWFTARFSANAKAEDPDQFSLPDDIMSLKVMVVDNNKTARIILIRQLEHIGYRVTGAESGEEAIHLLKTAKSDSAFDLVLLDWVMPGIDGFETARHIQSGMGIKKIPAIIMVTAYDKREITDQIQDIELKEILTKPIFPSDLFNAILSTFGKAVAKRKREYSEFLPDHVLGARVLVVEDNFINQTIARKILENAGVTVTVAGDGEQGLEKLITEYQAGNPFDVVLMDIQMPVMDGYTASNEIRKLPEFKDLPVIAMTANAFVSDRQKALEAGMNDHVAKPINVKKFFKVLGEWVHVPDKRQNRLLSDENIYSSDTTDSDMNELPVIDGLDTAVGIQNADKDRPLYEELLQDFLKYHADDTIKIKQAISDGDTILAERLAHTLKGVAGNIGAETLSQVSCSLEDAIHKADTHRITDTLPSVENTLQQLLVGIQKAYPDKMGKKQQTESVSSQVDIASLQPVLNRLKGYLVDDDPDAVNYFLENKDLLRRAIPMGTIAELEKNLRNFNFKIVRDDLVQLLDG